MNSSILASAQRSLFPHIQTTELVKGDAPKSVPRHLAEHLVTPVAFAYLDLDRHAIKRSPLGSYPSYLVVG